MTGDENHVLLGTLFNSTSDRTDVVIAVGNSRAIVPVEAAGVIFNMLGGLLENLGYFDGEGFEAGEGSDAEGQCGCAACSDKKVTH